MDLRTRAAVSLALSFVILLSSSTAVITVRSVRQNMVLWSPYGPREEDVTLNVYADCTSMFNDFQAGKLDITDGDLSSCGQNVAAYSSNPDFLVTSPTTAGEFAALNGWNLDATSLPSTSSLVSVSGHGFQTGYGFWPLLNMRQVPGSQTLCQNGVPGNPPGCTVNASYMPGGGDVELIRRAITQPPTGLVRLNPFQASTPAELEVLSLVFDTLLQVNPITLGTPTQQVFDWMATFHRSTYDSAANLTTQTWNLRNDLYFQDGVPLTSQDVCYTILAFRDVPSIHFGPASNPDIGNVKNCVSSMAPRTVQVVLSGSSPSYDLSIGSLPIIPKHIWKQSCGDPPIPGSPCANIDTMNQGMFIGSGPWACLYNLGNLNVGGPCTSSGMDAVRAGGWVKLKRYDALIGPRSPNGPGYMRCCPNAQGLTGSSLQKYSWIDFNDDGVVNIFDLAAIAIRYDKPDAYWSHPLFGCGGNNVDICDVAMAASYFGNDLTCDFCGPAGPPTTSLTFIDSQIDPFRVDLSQFTLYYLGTTDNGGIFTLYLAVLSGTVPANSISAQLSSDETHSWNTATNGPGLPVSGSSTVPGLITIVLTTVTCPGHYDLRFRLNGATITSDWDHIELGQTC